MSLSVDDVVPEMTTSLPTLRFSSIPTPPSTVRAPVSLSLDDVVPEMTTLLPKLRFSSIQTPP